MFIALRVFKLSLVILIFFNVDYLANSVSRLTLPYARGSSGDGDSNGEDNTVTKATRDQYGNSATVNARGDVDEEGVRLNMIRRMNLFFVLRTTCSTGFELHLE